MDTPPPTFMTVLSVVFCLVMLCVAAKLTLEAAKCKKRKYKDERTLEKMRCHEINPVTDLIGTNSCICQMGVHLPGFKKPDSWCRAQRTRLGIESYFLLPKNDTFEAKEWMVCLQIGEDQQQVELYGGGKSQTNKNRQKVLTAKSYRPVSAVHFHHKSMNFSGPRVQLHDNTSRAGSDGPVGRRRDQLVRPNKTMLDIMNTVEDCERDPAKVKASMASDSILATNTSPLQTRRSSEGKRRGSEDTNAWPKEYPIGLLHVHVRLFRENSPSVKFSTSGSFFTYFHFQTMCAFKS